MICNSCFHQSDCTGQPNDENRCHLYLKDGDIEFGDEISLNPIDTETFDYEDIERFFSNESPHKTPKNQS